ncbi:MAG: MipA/OmpV family protein [Azoarcus sp.]|nr:MipA/OmpV family protein [Azoarcus sp.]
MLPLTLWTLALPVSGEEKPLWEIGLGVGAVSFPEYRGSNRQRNLVLPLPYLVYRGEIFKADRDGLRGKIFNSDRVKLSLSASASIPVDSNSHGPRRGMPDLKPTVELGPSLEFNLWWDEANKARFDLRLPVRAAYTFSGKYVGVIFSPALNFNTDPFGHSGWNLGALAGPIFASVRQHKYFYDVKPRYALPDRPAYSASGGYSGTQSVVSLSKRFDKFWFGGFVRYDTLRGAVFADSPLVRRQYAWMGGLGITWMLGESTQTVGGND